MNRLGVLQKKGWLYSPFKKVVFVGVWLSKICLKANKDQLQDFHESLTVSVFHFWLGRNQMCSQISGNIFHPFWKTFPPFLFIFRVSFCGREHIAVKIQFCFFCFCFVIHCSCSVRSNKKVSGICLFCFSAMALQMTLA